ncbi:hypothetical protein [Streptomyces sp. ICBB 8177]|uniref:hypothetical protein n=1 Tax=Streptomyces sp. ICBB 8177 TaxID=563922 RepID=UPI000D67C22D|nr:hypothetical protein [Streptomyces sp. ICBB 8177]PWI44079.1 hypothetical protein CK485_18790 [Streptomyces sp. ICBB 8177]
MNHAVGAAPGGAGATLPEPGPGLVPAPGREALPDFTGVDLDDLLPRVSHPALAAVLPGLAARGRRPGEAAAYHEDAPDMRALD